MERLYDLDGQEMHLTSFGTKNCLSVANMQLRIKTKIHYFPQTIIFYKRISCTVSYSVNKLPSMISRIIAINWDYVDSDVN